MQAETIVRVLTIGSLAGLLFTVGLRLTLRQVLDSLRRCPFGLILLANFVVVPALATTLVALFGVEAPVATAMILLAAAPFAPVVPVFTRLARADLALAAGLTSLVPLVSAVLTPLVCVAALKALPAVGAVKLSLPAILLTLGSTILLPLAAGVIVHQVGPLWGQRALRPIEVVSEIAGALSLAFVTATQFHAILATGWRSLLVMVLVFEISLVLGYAVGGRPSGARKVVALGTSNRNIALALLVALESYPGTPVVPAVVANGLLLIFLGLLHVALWRWTGRGSRQRE
jgi:BASS family bile acid:Na+ symporter